MFRAISFLGLGYVGLTTAVCLASRGFKVIGFDVDDNKVKKIGSGVTPFFEPGLDELLKISLEKGYLKVTIDPEEAILDSEVTFITVATPSREDGSIDLSYVKEAALMIGNCLKQKNEWHLIVVKSTVVPTTSEDIVKKIVEEASGKICGRDFGLCVNPEFLREGSAVEDMFNPDRIIIGEIDKKSGDFLEGMYRKFYGEKIPPIIRTTPVNAEMIKYANNAFLATKVSFINMIANLCQKLPGADIEVVSKGIGLDKRIGPLFLKAGAGWGGSCWPKDLKALLNFGLKLGVELPIIEATIRVNDFQPYKVVDLARNALGGLSGKRISILGLAFKPNTDDMRNAVSIKIVEKVLSEGAEVAVYDPKAIENAKKIFSGKVKYAKSIEECLKGSDCAIIVTEWDEFKKLKVEDFIRLMRNPTILDARRVYHPKEFQNKVKFVAIGLG